MHLRLIHCATMLGIGSKTDALCILRLMPVVLMLVVDWMSYSSSENSTAEAKTSTKY